jgi:hypothetical protein
MKATVDKRKNIITKINKMTDHQLDELLKIIQSVETGTNNLKDTMLLAGSWKEIDDEIFMDFTEHLVERRTTNSRRSR